MNKHTKRGGFQGDPLDLSHIRAAPVGACRPRPEGNDFRPLGRGRLINYQSVASVMPMTYEPTWTLAYTQLTSLPHPRLKPASPLPPASSIDGARYKKFS